MPQHAFKFGEMFPADDVLAEWMATLAIAFNDLSLVRNQLGKDAFVAWRWFYWLRLGIAHFAEVATYLRETKDIPEIAEFIDSLPGDAQAHLDDCVARYEAHSSTIERIRNEAGFHYPRLKVEPGRRRKRPMQKILEALADEHGRVEGKTFGDARLLFADDVASGLVLLAHGTDEMLDAPHEEQMRALGPVHLEIEEGIASFVTFANDALQIYLRRKIEDGASWERLPDPPPIEEPPASDGSGD
jgi:hypothetical protein